MKIQINSLQALERLIGNDNELEIEIRNSIVEKFSKKYLKALVPEILKGLEDNQGYSIRTQIKQEFFVNVPWSSTLKPEIVAEMKKRLFDSVVEELQLNPPHYALKEKVDSILEQYDSYSKEDLEKLMLNAMEQYIAKRLKA